ncbi:MAG: hypothetical protein MUF57_09960, partial [Gammaproteobacteria bacterium]|nr:hypothetical protein [Gammaproteobacteria bacterium]
MEHGRAALLDAHSGEQGAEHRRDHLLATEGEGCGDHVRLAGGEEGEGRLHELPGGWRDVPEDGEGAREAVSRRVLGEPVRGLRVGPDLPHRLA